MVLDGVVLGPPEGKIGDKKLRLRKAKKKNEEKGTGQRLVAIASAL